MSAGEYAVTLLALTFVVYRVATFIALDDLIEGTRNKVLNWLERPHSKPREKPPWYSVMTDAPPLWRYKAAKLIGCPRCVSVWVAGFTLIAYRLFVSGDLPMPVFSWLAVAGMALIPWAIVDHE